MAYCQWRLKAWTQRYGLLRGSRLVGEWYYTCEYNCDISLLYSCNTHDFFYHPCVDGRLLCDMFSSDTLWIVQQLVHWCSFLFYSESFEWSDIEPTQEVILCRFDNSWRRELCGHARLAYGTKIIVSCTWTKPIWKNLTWIGVKNKRLSVLLAVDPIPIWLSQLNRTRHPLHYRSECWHYLHHIGACTDKPPDGRERGLKIDGGVKGNINFACLSIVVVNS